MKRTVAPARPVLPVQALKGASRRIATALVTLIAPLWVGLGLPAAQAAELRTTEAALPCTVAPLPVAARDAQGQAVFGDVIVLVHLSRGVVTPTEFIDGPAERQAAVAAALSRYVCDPAAPDRDARMTFAAPPPGQKLESAYPKEDPRRVIDAGNQYVRRFFPWRLDVLRDASALRPDLLVWPSLVDPMPAPAVQNSLDVGRWNIEVVFILEADGSIRDTQVVSVGTPRRLAEACRQAVKTARLKPATHGGEPIAVVVSQTFALKID